jgi:5'-3' exonuclease
MSLFAKDPPILAVDVANLAHRAYHANKHLSIGSGDDKQPTGHVYGSVKILLPLIKRFTKKGEMPTLWWALEGKPTRRQKIYPGYKAGRERDFEPYPAVRKLVLRMPGRAFYGSVMEADDILAMMTHKDTRGTRDLVMFTGDQDLWQFIGRPGVKVWAKDHVVQMAEVVAKFGVHTPRSLALAKALFGDTSDKVPPAFPSMKHKPLLDLINEREIFTPEAFRRHLVELPEKMQARIKKLWPDLERNWRLVKLTSKLNPNVKVKEGPDSPDRLVAYLEQFKCKSLYDPARELWAR